MEDFNAILLKLVFVAVTSPAWYPFLKTVWREFNQAMAEEGGVFGRIPVPREAERIARERRLEENPLIHLPRPTREDRAAGRRRFREEAASTGARGNARPQPREVSRPRFR